MKKYLLLLILCIFSIRGFAQKQVYIPNEFSDPNNPFHEWSWDKSYQSANFVVFWGNKVGTDPSNHPNSDLRFAPSTVAGYLEQSFNKFINEIGFISNDPSTNFGTYKTVVVMLGTFTNDGGGFAFGGSYDSKIGAMWVHPNATRDGGVLSHEFVHTLQNMNYIQENTGGGGFINNDAAGWFWECHGNYMRNQQFPELAAADMPRWIGTRHYHISSTRHHYSTFKWLQHIQSTDGINMVNRLWRESDSGETPIAAFKRLKGFSQNQLNDWLYDYAKREVNFDYPAMGFGQHMRDELNRLKTSTNENYLLWKEFAILNQVNASNGRYAIPDFMAPQQGGMNIIPLYTTCDSKTVQIKFKGHTEVNNVAGWRWGFVAVKNDGVNVRYGTMQSSSDGAASFTLGADESQMYLVVVGAPTTRTDYVWEPGWPKIQRFPYELRIENAVPEGYQNNFRGHLKTLYPGAPHSNGGGWVAGTATVAPSVYVGPKAFVVGNANLSGNVRVEKTARIESVTASGNVLFSGDVSVKGGTYSNTVKVLEGAVLMDGNASGNTILKGNFLTWGQTFGGTGVVGGGDSEIGSCSTAGVYLQTPHPNNGRENCDGKGAGDPSNIDVNSPYTLFSNSQMGWTPLGCGSTPEIHLGMSATASTSYVSSWETLSAVNDGFTPANSNDKSKGAYGNWNSPNTFQWVEYQWAQTQSITSVEVYWFDDNGGVLTPTQAIVEFWNGSTWINLGAVPLQKNAYNSASVGLVYAKRLRIRMKNDVQSTGILEFRVWGSSGSSNAANSITHSTGNNDLRVVGQGNDGLGASVKIFPNPVEDLFTIELNMFDAEEDVSIKILELSGKEVYADNLGKERKINLSKEKLHLRNTIYLVKVQGAEGVFTYKLLLAD